MTAVGTSPGSASAARVPWTLVTGALAMFLAVGGLTGWMVGASSSPVVGGVLPVLFGLVGTAGLASLRRVDAAGTVPGPSVRLVTLGCFGVATLCVACATGAWTAIRQRETPRRPRPAAELGGPPAPARARLQLYRLRLAFERAARPVEESATVTADVLAAAASAGDTKAADVLARRAAELAAPADEEPARAAAELPPVEDLAPASLLGIRGSRPVLDALRATLARRGTPAADARRVLAELAAQIEGERASAVEGSIDDDVTRLETVLDKTRPPPLLAWNGGELPIG